MKTAPPNDTRRTCRGFLLAAVLGLLLWLGICALVWALTTLV